MNLKKCVYITVILMLSLAGCGKNDMVSWIKTTEPLQEWYETTSSVASENITLMKSVDAFVKCHEEGVDYGLAYGITIVLCEKLELCDGITSISNEELAEYFANQENLYLLDFTLPMFETYFLMKIRQSMYKQLQFLL